MTHEAYIKQIEKRKFSFCIWYYLRNIMWLYLSFLLIIGSVAADHHHAWETGKEYHFHVRSRTLTVLDNLAAQFTGILIKGHLTVQVISSDTLQAVVSNTLYAPVHQVLPEGWDSEITDAEFVELSLSGKPFQIKLKQGLIQDIMVESNVPIWEVNLLKSILSQLQIDIQGRNVITSRNARVHQPFSTFRTMEDSVGGKCEVLYNITPLPEDDLSERPELVPLPNLYKDSHHIDITKTKNYTRCEQRMAYHSGIVGKMIWKPGSNDGLVSRSSTSRIIVSGNPEQFTIQSSVTTNKILVSSKIHDTYSGAVYSRVNLTLERVSQIANPFQLSSRYLTSTGNLVYMYNNPSSNLRKSRPSVNLSRNSNEENRSDDSNPSSSSSFNSEERDYLQPEPKLDEAPENPLLPYFIGYKGMSIQKSGENYVMITARLIASITNDVEFISDSVLHDTFGDTLNPYITLIELIRTMNVKQIIEIENKLYGILDNDYHNKYINEEHEKLFKQTAWDIFTNAVAQAGTGPALITVKNWVKNKKLEGKQAARVISQIPKAALTPTVEYVRAFFDLITDEQVRQQSCLNTTAPLAFAELVRYVQSNKSSVYYPVYSFGRMNSRQDNMFLETYIPYMATQLRQAIEEGDSPRIQTYILALGNFGHPKILSVFEPYLEGWLPLSKFQRLMMVISLNRLSENYPRVARSVAYKIYVNVYEAYELRCAAVSVIMKTNPPLSILQRMAENTNDEHDNNVNCVISSNINTLADLKQPELQDLANKARIAKQKLKPDCCTENYSQGIFKEIIIASLNIAQTSTLQTIGSDDSIIAKGGYFDIHQSIGGFNVPPSRLTYTISSIKELLDMWYQTWMMTKDEVKKKLIIEEIVEKLDLKPEDPEQIEGNIFTDTVFASEFYPFDNHTIERLINKFAEYMTYYLSVKPAGNFEISNMNYLSFYDMTLSFPTESGLPFINTLTLPKLTRISGGGSYAIKNSEVERYVELTLVGHILTIEKIRSRVGFVAPFEQRHYIAGIDINTQVFVPGGLNVSSWLGTKKFEIKTHPNGFYRFGTGHTALHHSVIPYTKRHDILSFTFPSNGTRLVNVMKPHKIEFVLGNSIFVIKSDFIDSSQASSNSRNEQLGAIYNAFYNSAAHYRRFDGIIFFPATQLNITEDVYMMYDGNSTEAKIPEIIDKQPESKKRKDQLLEEVSKDLDSAVSYFYDISLISEDIQQVFTIAWANSRLDNKFQTLLYWNMQSPNDGRVFTEFCTIGYIQTSPSIPLNFTKSIEETPKDEFKIEMRIGNCVNGETIKLKGNLTRSDDAKKTAMKCELVDKCREEMKQGNFWLPICQTANELIRDKDHLMMSVDTNSFDYYMFVNRLIFMLRSILPQENVQMFNPQNDNKIVDIDMKMSPDNNNATISVRTSMINVTFSLTDVIETQFNLSLKKLVKNSEAVCVLDKTQVATFDDKIYPLKLGNCWHVMMTTYPKRNPNNPEKTLNLLKHLRTTVMAREMDDGSKQMRMIFNDREIHLWKTDNLLEAMVNGQVVNFTRNSYREDDFEIYQMDGMIVIFSLEYASYAVYDGERILLRPSQKYIKAVRGLCGDYDMQSDNDFIAPKSCILSKPEEFAATYALTQEDCQGPALENKRRAEQSTCNAKSYHPSDVITDREAGRTRRNRG